MYINARPFLHTPKEDTRKYQNEILDVLIDINFVCRKYEINYFLEAGTALGAMRHKGFIPWDNDADILVELNAVKQLIIGLARENLFEKYDIWYYDETWGWMLKDIYIPGILKNPDNYCETSLNWALDKITYAVFRIVKKETMTIRMDLSKGVDTNQVAHFDTSLSTISLAYAKMLEKEKRNWRRRYFKKSGNYKAHPFVDVFPAIELTPTEFIKMKKASFIKDSMYAIKLSIFQPVTAYRKIRRFLFKNNAVASQKRIFGKTFVDYRKGVGVDYTRGIRKALKAKHGDMMVLSKTPWNLRKIIPYYRSELYPPSDVEFEGKKLLIAQKAHEVLMNHYKDYMTMPEEKERIQHAYHLDPMQFEQVIDINV